MQAVLRWLVPATIVGAWSAMLWHRYVLDLRAAIDADWGSLDLWSTVAVAGLAFLIVRELTSRTESRFTNARVPHWLQRLDARPLAVAALIAMLMLWARYAPARS